MIETLDIQAQLHEKWLIFEWALGIGLLMVGFACWRGFFKEFKSSHLPFISGLEVFRGFVLFLFVEVIFIPIIASLFYCSKDWDTNLTGEAKGWLHLFLIFGGFGAVMVAYSQMTALQRKQIWQQTSDSWAHSIQVGIGAWFIFFPIVLAFNQLVSLIMWYFFHHAFVEQTVVINLRQAMKHPFLFGVTAFAIVTLVPFTEEFLFRGLLQTWLKRKLNYTPIAIVISSLIFALFHFTIAQGLTNVELLSSLFLLSCALGFVYERQRSLWASIGLHGFFNFMSLLMIFKEN